MEVAGKFESGNILYTISYIKECILIRKSLNELLKEKQLEYLKRYPELEDLMEDIQNLSYDRVAFIVALKKAENRNKIQA